MILLDLESCLFALITYKGIKKSILSEYLSDSCVTTVWLFGTILTNMHILVNYVVN